MRIVSWNMNHCMRSGANHQRAWKYLQDDLAADLALVQEAVPPAELQVVYRPFDAANSSAAWGSAVVSFGPNLVLKPRPRLSMAECNARRVTGGELPDSHPGACAVADVTDKAGRTIFTVVSLYGQWETIADGRIYSCARLHRMISDLTGILATQRRCPVIVVGDLNITTQIACVGQTKAETANAATVLARLCSWGLVDVITATKSTRPKLAGCTCPAPETCAHV